MINFFRKILIALLPYGLCRDKCLDEIADHEKFRDLYHTKIDDLRREVEFLQDKLDSERASIIFRYKDLDNDPDNKIDYQRLKADLIITRAGMRQADEVIAKMMTSHRADIKALKAAKWKKPNQAEVPIMWPGEKKKRKKK